MSTAVTGRRLGLQAGEVIDRRAPLSFKWDGRSYTGFEGDTIVSALVASGVDVFSRSFKYKRPRGVLSATFHDPGCTVQVGDEPNVRAAHRRLAAGMDVSPENVWPSLKFDVRAANQLVGRFLSPGFYYKTFIKPQRLWPAYQKILARFAAGGVTAADADHGYYDKRYIHADVCVAGGGPAGIAAAVAAARSGASVLLVEEEYELGGHLRYGGETDLAALADLRAQVAAHQSIEVMTNAAVTGRYDMNWVAVVQRQPGMSVHGHALDERLCKVRAGSLVVASGLIERPYVFAGNDLPGVMLSTAVRRLVNLHAARPGENAVVFTANADGDACAQDLRRIGVGVTVVDARAGGNVVRAEGAKRVKAVELADGRRVECDLLVTAVGWTAATPLLNMAADRPVYDPTAARFFPTDRLAANVVVAGALAGDGSTAELVAHGAAGGATAAARAGHGSEVPAPELARAPHPELYRSTTHGIVDYSEDVSSKDLLAAKHEGYDSIELVKRYTTVTMGPSQGKLESVNAVAIMAEAHGVTDFNEIGTTIWRPPYVPITLGALGGRRLENIRFSPMQPWHTQHNAKPLVAGDWIRPEHYGDAAAEVGSVRSKVGIIDVTPLGKLDLRGPDVPKLLNLLYVNKWSKLPVGAVRYGVMCAEDGVVMDDGVTGRLAEDHYIMTTTSSGAATVWEWMENWLQTEHPDWQVHVTPVTTGYASMNVAGPKSRQLLGRVVQGVDLANEAFPYMHVRTATVAGIANCFMWRIGFTGELSYEIHVPAAYGLHVWEELFDAGFDLGVVAFGVEAQRIMRLEKGHFIVAQDTDGLTLGFGADLGWCIKLDKDDFAGKPELVWQSQRDDYQRLVGLQPVDPTIVPAEASQVVEGAKKIVGRITSSRMSPTLGRSICLGFVEPRLATPGAVVTCQLPDGRRVQLKVIEGLAHFDPDGSRMRM
jgi:sarcosine oxidase, subunit alpha